MLSELEVLKVVITRLDSACISYMVSGSISANFYTTPRWGKKMNDTSPEVKSRFFAMLMKKSGQERMKLGFSMFEMAKRQIVASAKMVNPDADSAEIRKLIFLRFYGRDFSPQEQSRILDLIQSQKKTKSDASQ